MKVTVTTYSQLWTRSLGDALLELGRHGFSQAEIMASPPHVDLGDAGQRWVEEAGGKGLSDAPSVLSVNPPGLDLNLASPDAATRQTSVEHYSSAIRGAGALGARYVIVVPGRRSPLLPCPLDLATGWLVESLQPLREAAAVAGVKILLENTPSGFLDLGTELAQLLADFALDDVALCYDVANGFMREDPAATLRELGVAAPLVHLSDTWTDRWAHAGIGEGEIDWPAVGEALAAGGVGRDVVIETIVPNEPLEGLCRDVAALRAAGWDVTR